jgi:hypothetical protein
MAGGPVLNKLVLDFTGVCGVNSDWNQRSARLHSRWIVEQEQLANGEQEQESRHRKRAIKKRITALEQMSLAHIRHLRNTYKKQVLGAKGKAASTIQKRRAARSERKKNVSLSSYFPAYRAF